MKDGKLSYEEFHKLATAPLPSFNIITPKPVGHKSSHFYADIGSKLAKEQVNISDMIIKPK